MPPVLKNYILNKIDPRFKEDVWKCIKKLKRGKRNEPHFHFLRACVV
jgi:hypothetical protein